MLLVNSTLHNDSFPLPPMTGLEATAVCIQLHNHNNLILASAYLPPSTTLSPSDLEAIFASQDAIILTGDLNCKHAIWNNTSTNKNGNTLLSYCLNKAITINYPNRPTHFPHNAPPKCPGLSSLSKLHHLQTPSCANSLIRSQPHRI